MQNIDDDDDDDDDDDADDDDDDDDDTVEQTEQLHNLSMTMMMMTMTMMMMMMMMILVILPLSQSLVVSPNSRSIITTANCLRRQCRLYAGFGKSNVVVVTGSGKTTPDDDTASCACGSTKSYQSCCKQFHDNTSTRHANPVELVRSRFSALCYNIPNYMIRTTHPKHKEFASEEDQPSKRKLWVKSLKAFAEDYEFLELKFGDEVNESQPSSDATEAIVNFTCKLKETGSMNREEEMTEQSLFVRENGGAWLYRDAKVTNPFKNKREEVKPVQRKMITTTKKGVPTQN